jgi:hypothetical protein
MSSSASTSAIYPYYLLCIALAAAASVLFSADRADAQVRRDVQFQQQLKELDTQKTPSRTYQPSAPQFAPPVIVQPPEFEEAAPRRRLRGPAPQGMALPRDKEIDQLKGVITQLREAVEKLNKAVEQLTERLPKQ